MDNGCPYSSAASNRAQTFIAGMELGYVACFRGYFLCRAVYGGGGRIRQYLAKQRPISLNSCLVMDMLKNHRLVS